MKLNDLFQDGMVFQVNKHIRVFGAGQGKVEVPFMGTLYFLFSNEEKWCLELPIQNYSRPYQTDFTI